MQQGRPPESPSAGDEPTPADAPSTGTDQAEPTDDRPTPGAQRTGDERTDGRARRLAERPTIRIGAYAWAIIGLAGVFVLTMMVIGRLTIVVIPLVLALFPAAVLTPAADRLKRRGLADALVASLLVLGTLVVIIAMVGVLFPLVGAELDDIGEQVTEGINELRTYLRQGPFGLEPIDLNELIDQAQERLAQTNVLQTGALGSVAGQAGRFLAGLAVFLVALFFYLKDGPAMAAWLNRLFPRQVRTDAANVGDRVWHTIGSYFRGQLLVAFIDAVGIALGLVILQVPLALPVGIIVFFGSLFPVVGAFVSGFVAVAVALATRGLIVALIVLGIVLAVQQLEGNVLQPFILGRATALHPLAVVSVLIAGGSLFGIVGAFIAVPVAASAWKAISYLRERVPG